MGKGQSPTSEELGFVYGLFAGGKLDTEVMTEYAELKKKGQLGLLPFREDIRFVRQRRKEYEAAKKVLKGSLQEEEMAAHRQSQHEDDLAYAAMQFLRILRFVRWKRFSPEMEDEQVGDTTINKDERAEVPEIDGNLLDCLIIHLIAEEQKLECLKWWRQLRVKDLAEDLLVRISEIALTRSFSGTCPSCPKARHSTSQAEASSFASASSPVVISSDAG